MAGKVPSPGQTVYAASKHAVNGYFHSLRSEVLTDHSTPILLIIRAFSSKMTKKCLQIICN